MSTRHVGWARWLPEPGGWCLEFDPKLRIPGRSRVDAVGPLPSPVDVADHWFPVSFDIHRLPGPKWWRLSLPTDRQGWVLVIGLVVLGGGIWIAAVSLFTPPFRGGSRF